MNIDLHIEEIVLQGIDLPPGGRERLHHALSQELTQLLQLGADRGFEQGYAVPHVISPTLLSLSPQFDLQALGRQLAGAVHDSLTHSHSEAPR